MSNLVIVAIPDENDRVWKISSEQVPHLTLLFLGDVDQVVNVDKIVEFVGHATDTALQRFYLPVDRRDTLGDDEADVLFFRKGSYDMRALRQFRSTLLQDSNVRTAFDSAEQFDGPWQPHVTLGYPTAKAKPEDTEGQQGFYDVQFNKIAVWLTDYDGPEFLLRDWWDEFEAMELAPGDFAMSDTTRNGAEVVSAMLEHHGVRGMKWGVRRSAPAGSSANGAQHLKVAYFQSAAVLSPAIRKHTSTSTQAKVALFGGFAFADKQVRDEFVQADRAVQVAKADRKWEKGVKDGSAYAAVHSASTKHFNEGIAAVNARHPADFSRENHSDPKSWGPEYKKYMADVSKLSADSLGRASKDLDLTNASGTKTVEVSPHGDFGFTMRIKEVKHADGASTTLDIQVTYQFDVTGRVTGFVIDGGQDSSGALAQSATKMVATESEIFVDALLHSALEHHGIRGMKWGVRKEPPKAVAATAASKVPHGDKRKTRVEVSGGENHPAHHDAIKVAEAKAKLSKSGPAALSNQELRDVAQRVQLEQQVRQLVQPAGKKFVTNLLRNQGNQAANAVVGKQVRRKLALT